MQRSRGLIRGAEVAGGQRPWSTKRKASAASGGAAICTAGAFWNGNVDGRPKITKAGMAKKAVTDGTIAFGHMIFELTKASRKSITIRTPS
jgi:hypothetical protein